jgi:hypothetical protein
LDTRQKRMNFALGLTGLLVLLVFLFQALLPERGLTGLYFSNPTWTDPPARTRFDPRISFDQASLGASAGVPNNFSVRWEGYLYAPRDGEFLISATSDDGSWIYVDGRLVIDNGGNHAAATVQKEVALTRGSHTFVVKYNDEGGSAVIDVPSAEFRFYPKAATRGRYLADRAGSVLLPALQASALVSGFVWLWCVLASGWIWLRDRIFVPFVRRLDIPRRFEAARKKAALIAALAAASGLALWGAARLTPVHGLAGTYFANPSLEGEPVYRSVDRRVRFETEDFGKKVGTEVSSSAVWEGYFRVPRKGTYRFSITSDDGSWVYVDDALVVDNGGVHASVTRQNTVSLPHGSRRLVIKFFDAGGGGLIDFTIKHEGGLPLFHRPVVFYPREVRPAVATLDAFLFYAKTLLVAVLVCTGGLFVLFLPGLLAPALEGLGRFEGAASVKLGGFLDLSSARFRALAVASAALLALTIAARFIEPDSGLVGTYFSNETWEGRPEGHSLDRRIRLQKSAMSPRAGGEEVFSVIWEGQVYVPRTSRYRFSLGSDDGSLAYLDGGLLIDNGGRHGVRTVVKEVDLERGNHKVLIKYFESGGDGEIVFRVREAKPSFWKRRPVALFPKPVDRRTYALNLVASSVRTVAEPLLLLSASFLVLVILRRTRPGKSLRPVLILLVFVVLAGRYEARIFRDKSNSVRGCDYYAYLQGADLMARNGFLRTEFTDPLIPRIHQALQAGTAAYNEIFFLSPHGYYVQDLNRGLVYNVFPPGTSMLLYPFVKAAGRQAAFFVLPILNVVLIVLFFLLGARAVNPGFGLLLAASVFFNLQVFGNSVLIMSDVPSMALLAAGAYCLFRYLSAPRWFYPFIAGACFGFSVAVRYSNVVGALPLGLLLWARFRTNRRGKDLARSLVLFGAGGFLLGAVPLGLYTHHLFGTVFRMVYEPMTQSRMSLSHVDTGILFYSRALAGTFGGPMLVLMGVGLVGSLIRRSRRVIGIVCLSGPAAFLGFYLIQSIRHERYLVPAFPFLGVLFALGVLEVARVFRRSQLLTFLLVAACAAFPLFRSEPTYFKGTKTAEAIVSALREHVGPDAVVFCDDLSGSVRLYGGIPGYRFLWTDAPTIRDSIRVLEDSGRCVYFFLDSALAEQVFGRIVEEIPGLKERTRLEERFRGFPLYRVLPAGSGARDTPGGASR